jgi:hypothetical protein
MQLPELPETGVKQAVSPNSGHRSSSARVTRTRFAVCNGASFLQTWVRNNQPVGESMFNFRVVGTIAKNSRTINFQYYFTDFATTGTTAAAAMPITTKGNIPQSWPAGARYTRGGDKPGTKTFTQLKALRTFNETVNAKPGQGNTGATDLLFAVYEPAISYTPSAGWIVSGAHGGKLFMLAPRWETATYLPTPSAAATQRRRARPPSATCRRSL